MTSDDVKFPLFHGNEAEDPEHNWFLWKIVLSVKQVLDEDIKKGQLVKKFQGRTLEWYMKFMQVPTGNPMKTLEKSRTRLIKEFKKPKYESQYIIDIKEIKQYPNESV